MKNLTWQNPEQLFVAQVLINKVKSKCCGIKDKYENDKECHKQATVDLLKEGVGEGVIRADINMEIVATLLTFQFELLKKSDQIFNSKYTFTEIFETIFKSFIRGIATPEGVKYTDEFFEENR